MFLYTYMRSNILINRYHVLYFLGNEDHEQYYKDNFMVNDLNLEKHGRTRRQSNNQDCNGYNLPLFYHTVHERTCAKLWDKVQER